LIKLAIITTHPVQYNAPLFRLLTERKNIAVKVFYTWSQTESGIKYDPGFGKTIQWDIPLLDGYEYNFVQNISKAPNSSHYRGINNPTLIKEIQNWKANAIMVYGWNFKSHLKAIRFFKNKIPVLFRGDSTLLDEKPGLKKILRRIFLKFIYSYVDIALYAGVANKAYFVAHGFNEKQLVFMPHAIDNKRFAAGEENIAKGEALREKLSIPKKALVFLFAGKLDDNKNTALLISAFLDSNNDESYLLIVGNGNQEIFLKSKYEHKNNIRFLDFQNQQNMPSLYACANVFVLPSKSETWGLAVNEAMAAGNAIILSDACGASFNLVRNGENGFVFKSNNEASLKNALQLLMNDTHKTVLMGQNSILKIKDYSYSTDCIALEKVLLQINTKVK
jgi:glycosyltransferase involved in cell wall biosynthesis